MPLLSQVVQGYGPRSVPTTMTSMPANLPAQFIFCTCQAGAELALKREVAVNHPHLRLAFSRPGFVTFKFAESPASRAAELPRLSLARAIGWSLGKVEGIELHELAKTVWKTPTITAFVHEKGIDDLHVWQRDSAIPGDRGFEPGPTPLSKEAEQALRQAAPQTVLGRLKNSSGQRYSTQRLGRVLDVVLVEPNQWWIGCHTAVSRTDRWPGGVIPIDLPEHAVSRAYLKMAEALEWSAIPTKSGDQWAELGCAPGGASQALLDRGMIVIGIDPAEVDPEVLAHDNFTHVRARTMAVPRRVFRHIDWLAADINAAPMYTLDAVEAIVSHREANLRGLLLTLKLPHWELALPDQLTAYVERIQSWGYQDVRLWQLAHNRRELCAVALRSRGQRRRTRNSRAAPSTASGRSCTRFDKQQNALGGPHFNSR